MRPRPGFSRLAVRHALLAALLGVTLGVVISVLQVQYDYRESVETERREIVQMLAVMREPAAQAAYNLNEEAAEVIVKGALAYGPVQEARLRSDFGETLAEGRDEKALPHAGAWWMRFVAPTQDYGLSLEYGAARQRVGELQVVTAQAPRVERFLQGTWRHVGLTVLRSLALALALGVLSFLTLTRPLSSIARRIGRGPAMPAGGAIAEAARRDEIGQIAAAFERYEREAGERARSLEATARALAASEVRYRRIVETAGEGVWQFDEHGRTQLVNEAMARMLATTPDAMFGRSPHEYLATADGHLESVLLQPEAGGGSERHELRFRRADGQTLWAEVSTCPIADAEGRPAGTLAMVTDVTGRRRRDEQLRASNTRLTAMVSDLQRHKSDMALITELNQRLQSARSEAEAFEVIRAAAAQLFADTDGGFAVAGPGNEMHRVGGWGAPDSLPPSYERSACWAIRRGRPHLQVAHHGVHCGHQRPEDAGAMLCTPLYVEGQLIGVLHVHGRGDLDTADGSVQQRAEIFGEVVKLGLSNLRLRDSLREQALRDPLTGLPNRRLFDESLPRELARCLRAGQPLTLAVIDVDHFKRFNDSYGHDAGDRVLSAVARTLLHAIRDSDMAARYGGDEFMCLLPGMEAADARVRFEQALARIGAAGADAGLPDETVSFTVGLASAPGSGSDATTLKHAADAALYVAKAKGRNRVEVAGIEGAGGG